MTRLITGRPIADMKSVLADAVDLAGGQRAWSRKTGISQTEISLIINGHRAPSEAIANALGYVVHQVCVPVWGQNA
ncbi:helix-turn-helix transcriptional regulator [Gluconacetobacter azotocaptans]|uniref:helix-turn-helix domain-containing protein n=1 Tax=Gluconacetobacter azotocaptans TaxID=142834 RepID=UPI00195BACDF|nr:helix-turn-helix transcriptional regulator [Gluconacetobacter azotocaptans]MBM9401581.1 helix-turn-helix transcriptional regulator [Gluconacetobacter azotocaptans]